MKVKIREQNKKLNSGRIKVYYVLDTFLGYNSVDGKKKQNRKRESTGLSHFLKPKTVGEKEEKKFVKNAVLQMQLKRENEFISNQYDIVDTTKRKQLLLDYLEEFIQINSQSNNWTQNTISSYVTMFKHLKSYSGGQAIIAEVDYQFCKGFMQYLLNTKKKNGEPLGKTSTVKYFKNFAYIIKELVNEGIIVKNPTLNVRVPEIKHKRREYLTNDEIKLLIDEPLDKNRMVKRFYLISCFTGLRHSDIKNLKWKNLVYENGNPLLRLTMQKTEKHIDIPLNKDAMNILGEPKGSEDYICPLKYHNHNNVLLQHWVYRAGIKKHITPHTARHTFSVRFVSETNDIYTLSNILGHTDIKTTMRYLQLMDDKPRLMINSLKQLTNNE